ncbi:MAG: hypothetical protein ACYCO9_06260 [Streptosporangiaceae bacterium]
MIKITVFRMGHLAQSRLGEATRRIPALRPRLIARFTDDLRYLHDVLQATPLRDHYWVWSGMLLGWAREGAILEHDSQDADFAVLDKDFDRLVSAAPTLVRAGFACDRRFVNNDGVVTELTFARHGARFDFFRMFPAGDRLRYYTYSISLKEILELEFTIPSQPLVPFDFIGRTWLKPEDHELELKEIYGEWRVPDPEWSYLEAGGLVERRISQYSHFDWRGGEPYPVSR